MAARIRPIDRLQFKQLGAAEAIAKFVSRYFFSPHKFLKSHSYDMETSSFEIKL